MELYIPPPTAYLPRLPPPRPIVPAVPIVPPPDLPDTVHAPEGPYTQNSSLFPNIGTAVAPLPYDHRVMQPSATIMGGSGGFLIAPPGPPGGLQAGQTAMSFGSTIVNGQTQPVWPVRMSWVSVYFPPKGVEQKGGGFGGFMGMGGGGSKEATTPSVNGSNAQPQMSAYEPSITSDDSSPSGSDNPPPPIAYEVPLSALPQQQAKIMGMAFSKASVPAGLPRPKNNLRSSSSTFVTRLQALDTLPKIMAERGRGGGETVRWGFWNLGRTFGWGEEGGRVKDALARVTFSQVPICHAVNLQTAGPDRVDVVVGFQSGDLVWLDFVIGRYTRINKGGLLNNTPVLSVRFDPRYPHHFIAAFEDSTILMFNLFAEDPVAAVISANPMPWTTYFEKEAGPEDEKVTLEEGQGEKMLVWRNEEFGNLGDIKKNAKEERPTWAGRNPMAAYKIGKTGKNITTLAYSPDATQLAVVAQDGMLRLIDVAEEKLTDTFAGYFGALNCVAWSPDSRFIAVGGQDDLITIFSAREHKVVARCQGHSAFVSAITFDYTRGGGYRFGSVGEDGKLILWDFTVAQLHRPRHHHLSNSHRLGMGSTLSLPRAGSKSNLPASQEGGLSRYHPAPPRNDIATLQPVMARLVEGNLINAVHFTAQAIYTVSRSASLKIWQRPPRQVPGAKRGSKSPAARNETLRSPRGGDVSVTA